MSITSVSSQLFWLSISFLIVCVYCLKIFIPRIFGIIKTREQKIIRHEEQARHLEAKAVSLRQTYDQEIYQTHLQVRALFRENIRTLEERKLKSYALAQEEINESLSSFEHALKRQKEEALSSLEAFSKENTSALIDTMIGRA
jgi:F0F1-type ATP synthase membrane subunit b/b'